MVLLQLTLILLGAKKKASKKEAFLILKFNLNNYLLPAEVSDLAV
jgi:hypothetical protein